MNDEKNKIICPFCGGEGRQYQKTWIKFMYPLLFLDKQYKCKQCKEMFSTPHKHGTSLQKKKSHLAINIIKAIIIIFFLWFLYSFITATT